MGKKLSLTSNRLNLGLFFFLQVFFLNSCSLFDERDIDFQSVDVRVNIIRLDSMLYGASSKQDIKGIVSDHRSAFNLYLDADRLPHDSVLVNLLYDRINDPFVDTFHWQCDSVFSDFSARKNEIRQLYQHVKYYYPDFQEPAIYTFFTAFLSPKDILVNPELITVGLEYFIGANARYVSNDPQYILDRYQPESLVPTFMGLGISNFYNETDNDDHSLVAEMIYYGKAHYFLSRMAFGIKDEMNLGFTKNDLSYFKKNERGIWAYMLEKKLLFETNRIETAKYVSERPKTVEIAPECPGRVGRWIGFQIVKSYMKKNNVSLQQLMAEKDAQKIFRKSSYNPSK